MKGDSTMLVVRGQLEMLVGEVLTLTDTHQIRRRYNTSPGEGVIIWGVNKDNVLTYEDTAMQLEGDVSRLYDIILSGAVVLIIGVKKEVYTNEFKQGLREGIQWYQERGVKTLDGVVLESKALGIIGAVSDATLLWGE